MTPAKYFLLVLHCFWCFVRSHQTALRSLTRLQNPTIPAQLSEQSYFDINLLHTTDIHGWITGHKHQPTYDCDIGDVYSFSEHLRNNSLKKSASFFLMDGGDVIEGTGISDATSMHGLHIFEALKYLQYDGLTAGNHDVGHLDVVDYIHSNFSAHWNGNYITSNVIYKATHGPLGSSQYHTQVTSQGLRVLKLGFLYNFLEHSTNVEVIPPEKSVKEPYFKEAMAMNVDLVVVIMHIAPDQADMKPILHAIRTAKPDIAIVFLAGHSHRMRFHTIDNNAFLIQSDHYMYHLGFVSLRLMKGRITNLYHKQVQCNRKVMAAFVGVPMNKFLLPKGLELKKKLKKWDAGLGLNKLIGRVDFTYYKNLPAKNPKSLRNYFVEYVIPNTVFMDANLTNEPFYISGVSFLRDNLYQGSVVEADLYAIIPFSDRFHQYEAVSGVALILLLKRLFSDKYWVNWGPEWFMSQKLVHPDSTYTVVGTIYDFFKLDQHTKSIQNWTEVSANISTRYEPRSSLYAYLQRERT
eukprot:CFRG5759T1